VRTLPDVATYDPFDAAVLEDPYPAYAAVRAAEGLTYLPIMDSWLVSRHEDVTTVLRQARLYSSARGMGDLLRMAFGEGEGGGEAPRLLILEDPPVHTVLRRMVARGFTPSRILEAQPMVEDVAVDHVRALIERGSDGDLVRDLAIPLPVRVIAELLGIPPSMFGEFRSWSEAIVKAFSLTPDAAGTDDAVAAMASFFSTVVAERIAAPGDDLVSLLIRRGAEGEEPLSVAELVNFCFLLLIAGNETTTNLLGNALQVLFDRPDIEAALRAEPGRIVAFVEEVLRYDAPVQSLFRGLSEPATLSGVESARGCSAHGAPRRRQPGRCALRRRRRGEARPVLRCCTGPPRVRLGSAPVPRRGVGQTGGQGGADRPAGRHARAATDRSPEADRQLPAAGLHLGAGARRPGVRSGSARR
jgi:cytochrome P450